MARTIATATLSANRISLDPGAVVPPRVYTWLAVFKMNAGPGAGGRDYVVSFNQNGTHHGIRVASGPTLTLFINSAVVTPAVAVPLSTTEGYILLAVSSNATTTHRIDKYVYGTNTWTQTTGTSAAVTAATPALISVQIGNYSGQFDAGLQGDIAALAVFDQQLSLEEIQSCAFSMNAWLAQKPVGMWILDQHATTQEVQDRAGGGAGQSAVTGTTVATTSVPVLTYGHPILQATRGASIVAETAPAGTAGVAASALNATVEVGGEAGSVRFNNPTETLTANLALGSQTDLTICSWVRLAADRNNYASAWFVDNNATSDTLGAQTGSDGTSFEAVTDGATVTSTPKLTLTVGTWYFAALVGTGGAGTLYLRAEGAGSWTTATWTGGAGPSTTANNLRVGDSTWGDEWLDGNITAVKVWTSTLTQTELDAEYASRSAVRTANLAAAYELKGPADLNDYSGNGRHLTGGLGASTEPGPAFSSSTSAPAAPAEVAAAALDATVTTDILVPAEVASVAAVALDATVTVVTDLSVPSEAAAVAAVALDATVTSSTEVTAGVAQVAVSGLDNDASITTDLSAPPATANVVATALDATISTLALTNAPAEAANVAAAGLAATVTSVSAPTAGAAAVGAAGQDATVTSTAAPTVDVALGSATALPASSAVATSADVATGTAAALDASISTLTAAQADAGAASVAGAALDAAPSVSGTATEAAVSAAALDATISTATATSAPAGTASVTAAGLDATATSSVLAPAGTANVAAEGLPASGSAVPVVQAQAGSAEVTAAGLSATADALAPAGTANVAAAGQDATGAPALSAAAGAANVAAAALGATPGLTAPSEAAHAVADAPNAGNATETSTSAPAATPAVDAAALDATVSTLAESSASASTATVAATALDATTVTAASAFATTAAVTADAANGGITTETQTSAPADDGSVSAAALDATVVITVSTETGLVAATAGAATSSLGVLAATPVVTASALDASKAVVVNAQVATVSAVGLELPEIGLTNSPNAWQVSASKQTRENVSVTRGALASDNRNTPITTVSRDGVLVTATRAHLSTSGGQTSGDV